jgi:hypothetical protein
VAVEEVAAFDVADEVDVREGAQQREGVVGEGVALGVFFADGEQADAGVVDEQDVARVHVAHDGELDEVVGVAVDVGADVEQQGWAAGDRGQNGARAGRWTPANMPRTILAVAMAAPVLPAVKKPAAAPSRTMRRPTRMEESRLARTAWAALSSMADPLGGVDDVDGGAAVPGQRGARRARLSAGRRTSSGPTRWTRTS